MVNMTITRNTETPEATYNRFDEVFEVVNYPAGERHVRILDCVDASAIASIEARARNFDDLAMIVTADRILRRLGHIVEWFIPYFPFARHDRRNDAVDGLEVELALELVSELNLVIADPHSEVTSTLRHFDQAEVVNRFEAAGLFDDDPIVVIPDAGAAKKAYSWLNGRTVVQALKRRDPRTGRLSGFQVLADDLGGRPCIIVDDICDGGGTFLGLAAELKAHGAGPLTLAVTHGLFTKGTDVLLDAFDTVACLHPTDDVDAPTPAGVTTIPFQDLYTKGAIT